MPQTEHPVSRLVPDGYRARQLPEDVRQWIDEQARKLSMAHSQHTDADGELNVSAFREAKREQLEAGGWAWYAEATDRIVAGLGKTINGNAIYHDTYDAVVIKFDPTLTPLNGVEHSREERNVSSLLESQNLYALAIWKWACDHGDEAELATLLDHSEYGDWIAQKYHIPIYKDRQRELHARPTAVDCAHIVDGRYPEQYANRMEHKGYEPHVSNGDIGLDENRGKATSIDYGSNMEIDGTTIGDLLDYTLAE
jgi:hypothetical protein